jgi:UTP-glucose-1-phosphate uridylyltransferase
VADSAPARVVVAAGGLGTRVHGWARFIPKEFYPVGGRPGIVHLLEEIAAAGPARVAVIYHPYYEQFAAWARQVLGEHDHARYSRAARHEVTAAVPPGLTVSFIPQHGTYADLTSVLNGADHLGGAGDLYIAFADNLYTGPSPLRQLRAARHGHVTVLASRYQRRLAGSRGILITRPAGDGQPRQVTALIEKPAPAMAAELESRHGAANLLMLEGRARITAGFLAFARTLASGECGASGEPKLALVIGAYARAYPVLALLTDADVIDLGIPRPAARAPVMPQTG